MMLGLGSCIKRARNFLPKNPYVHLDSTNLPIVWIDVDGDSIKRDKRIGAHMKIIYNGEGRLNYADTITHPGQHIDYQGYIALRHRGNSTYNDSPKKPYSFRTLADPMWRGIAKKKRVSLLGMPKDNNWALLAPYADKSMIRDLLAFEISRPWMEYVPEGHYCELILDGTYYGIYILSEVVSRGRYRLNLEEPTANSGDDLTGGYLVEVDCDDDITRTSKYNPVNANGVPYKDKHVLFQFKSPDYEEMTRAQRHYIINRIDMMEKAFATGNYEQFIDVMTFIDYQIAMELSHNVDGYRLSGKFYKRRDSEDPRFKMAIWDFNIAYGNADHREGWRTDTWIYQNNDVLYREQDNYLVPFWWYILNNDPNYTALLKQRWAQYRNSNLTVDRIDATIDSLAQTLVSHGAISRNSDLVEGEPEGVGKRVWPNHYIATDYNDEINHLKQWLAERIAWMDKQLEYQPEN